MKKILLILEDFAERAYLSTLLKKVGWDVEIAQSEVGVSNLIMSFSPDIILVNAFGNKVKGEFLALKLKEQPKRPLIFLVTKGRRLADNQLSQLQVDGFFESPVDIKKLFESLESRGGVSASSAFEKLNAQRSGAKGISAEEQTQSVKNKPGQTKAKVSSSVSVTSTKQESASQTKGEESSQAAIENPQEAIQRAQEKRDKFRFNDPDRAKRNEIYLKGNKTEETLFNGISKEYVTEQVKEFRALSDDPELKAIDDERKAFVNAMFEMSKK